MAKIVVHDTWTATVWGVHDLDHFTMCGLLKIHYVLESKMQKKNNFECDDGNIARLTDEKTAKRKRNTIMYDESKNFIIFEEF